MPSKKRLIGRNARLRALTTVFPDIKQRYDEKLWLRREVGRDDILDAYAGLWSACRLARPSAKHLELGGGERDGRGVLMRIIV